MPIQLQPTSVIKTRLGIQPNGPIQALFTATCYKKMDKYVPKDEGNLRINVDIQTNKIIYESPYARYQYYGIREDGSRRVTNYTTPGTGPYWDKRMWTANGQDIVAEIQNSIMKRGGK